LAVDATKPAEAISRVEEAEPAEPVVRPSARPRATASDLAMLRTHADVRARCIAAVLVPFVLYTVVLMLIGAIGAYLIWIWIPLISAGVTAGAILDAAHRRYGTDDAPSS
jgi:hypothetical protein